MAHRTRKQTRLLCFIGFHRVGNKRNLRWEQVGAMFKDQEGAIIAGATKCRPIFERMPRR